MYIRPGLYSRTWHWRFPPQCSHSVWLLAFGPYHTFFTQLAMHRITDLISPAHLIDIQFYFYHINFFLFKKGGKGSIIQGFTPHESKLRLTGEGNEVEVWKLSDKTKILRWQPRGATPLRVSLFNICPPCGSSEPSTSCVMSVWKLWRRLMMKGDANVALPWRRTQPT